MELYPTITRIQNRLIVTLNFLKNASTIIRHAAILDREILCLTKLNLFGIVARVLGTLVEQRKSFSLIRCKSRFYI